MTDVDTPSSPSDLARLEPVRRYEILDAPADGAFDRITALAARVLDVPIALVSVVDRDRIWFRSHHGLPDVRDVERELGLHPSTVLGDEPWVVTDATDDPGALADPQVAGELGLRFYAGVPLRTADRSNIGTLCVIDRRPRQLEPRDLATLEDLAALVVEELELRQQTRSLVTIEAQLRREAEHLADTLQATLLPPRPPAVPGMDIAARFRAGEAGLRIGGDFYDVFRLGANDWGIVLGDACGRGAGAASLAATTRWCIRAASVREFSPAAVLADVDAVLLEDGAGLLEDGAGDDRFCTALFARLELDTCGAWVTVANAGHPLPVLVRASDKMARRGSPAWPLGLFEGFEATDERVGLGPGDFLVLYTDGITEARSGSGSFFGDDGLTETLRRCVGAPSAAAVADAVMDAAGRFAAEGFGDDAAVLVVRVPDEAGTDPMARVVEAIGVPAGELRLPGYPYESGA